MADPFDPLPPLPARGADLDVLEHNAKWAKTFEPSTARLPRTGTSLALRARHHQDVNDFADAVENERLLAQEERLMQDKNAANFYFRERAAAAKEKMDAFNMRLRTENADRLERFTDSQIAAREARAKADAARQMVNDKKEQRNADIELQASNLESEMIDLGFSPNTPEHEDALVGLTQKYRLAEQDKILGPQIVAARKARAARVGAQRLEEEARAAGMVPSLKSTSGRQEFKLPKPQPDPELEALKSQLRLAESNQRKAEKTEQAQYEPGLLELRKKIAERQAGAQPPAIAERPRPALNDIFK